MEEESRAMEEESRARMMGEVSAGVDDGMMDEGAAMREADRVMSGAMSADGNQPTEDVKKTPSADEQGAKVRNAGVVMTSSAERVRGKWGPPPTLPAPRSFEWFRGSLVIMSEVEHLCTSCRMSGPEFFGRDILKMFPQFWKKIAIWLVWVWVVGNG